MGELDYDQVLDELTSKFYFRFALLAINYTQMSYPRYASPHLDLTKKTDVEETPSYPEILDKYLEGIAKNGDIVYVTYSPSSS